MKVQVLPSDDVVHLVARPGCRRHVLHRVAGEVVVGQAPHLVGRGLEAEERVERVDVAGEADGEGRSCRPRGRARWPRTGPGWARGRRAADRPPRRTVPGYVDGHEAAGGAGARPSSTASMASRAGSRHSMRHTTPELLAHLARAWLLRLCLCASALLVSTLRAEMVSRLPPADVSPTWRRSGFPTTRDTPPLVSDYGQILKE